MHRRDVLKLGTAATALWFARMGVAQGQSLRVLILGGTGFIGPHFVATLRAAGHKLTLLNRGRRNPPPSSDVDVLIGDRNGQMDAIRGREWDVVIDNSGYTPKQVKLSTDILRGRVGHYIFVSSISAYADLTPPGIDEDYALATLADPSAEQLTDSTYGGLKALCERTVEQAFGKDCAIMRPTYIVGPGDPTDRFTYWPVRAARGGEMLAPGKPTDPIQFIDVRDLADFMRQCVEHRIAGKYNICNPPGAVTMGDLLETAKRIAGADTRFVWAPAEFLTRGFGGFAELVADHRRARRRGAREFGACRSKGLTFPHLGDDHPGYARLASHSTQGPAGKAARRAHTGARNAAIESPARLNVARKRPTRHANGTGLRPGPSARIAPMHSTPGGSMHTVNDHARMRTFRLALIGVCTAMFASACTKPLPPAPGEKLDEPTRQTTATTEGAESRTLTSQLDWASEALRRNPQLEVLATDTDAGVFTLRMKDTGEIRAVRVTELAAVPIASLPQ
jgi:2'-hydroxyisoflavone reductase